MPKAKAEGRGVTIVYNKGRKDVICVYAPGRPKLTLDYDHGTTLVIDGVVSICTPGEVSYEEAAFGKGREG